jgi:hypothetical protein
MFSLREDTVLDPFLGTGTTTVAAMATGRNSVGIEIDPNLKDYLQERFEDIVDFSNKLVESRLENHLQFVQERTKAKGNPGYCNKVYGFPVMTSQEVELMFDELEKTKVKDNVFEINYKEAPSFSLKEGRVKSISTAPLSKWT